MFNRSRAVRRPKTARSVVFPGPVRGLIKNESLAVSRGGGAEVLDNFFPTPEGARMRGGSSKHATVGAAVVKLMAYDSGPTEKLFAATANAIYDVTSPADPDVAPTADVSGLGSGDWSYVQFETSSGEYLIAVDGVDDLWLYDGTDWWDINSSDIKILPYDNQTGEFTAGLTVTGGTSGDTGTIFLVEDSGTSGNLYIKDATGDFQNNETITDTSTGSAQVDTSTALDTKYTGITGSNTSAFSHVWAFKKRLFFIEGGTMSAWYLGTLAIGGTATEFPLQGLFKKGGALLFGATWSQDAGDGLDDFCLFFTDEGEVAVYQGTDPASWSLVGVYDIGVPLGKDAHFRSGGDLAVVTEDGIVPISQAISKDRTGLAAAALTFPIEELWREVIDDRRNAGTFSCVLWHKIPALMVGIPSVTGYEDFMLVANARTGAWCRYTGWAATTVAVVDGEFYYGTADSTVIKGETTGKDLESTYSAVWVPRFTDMGTPVEKTAVHARFLGRTVNPIGVQLFANADFEVDEPVPLPADADPGGNVWGTAVWGTDVWGTTAASTKETQSSWQAVAAVGQFLAPGLQMTTGRATKPEVDIVSITLQFELGEVMG